MSVEIITDCYGKSIKQKIDATNDKKKALLTAIDALEGQYDKS